MQTAVRQPFFTRDRDFYARFFRLLFYIALQNVIVTSVSLADNIMLGSYSESALAGVAQVNQIQFLLQMTRTETIQYIFQEMVNRLFQN